MVKYNFHTHSQLDDGQGGLEDYVQAALDRGLQALGFSAHSPLPLDNQWSLPAARLPEYVALGKRLKAQYRDHIRLFLGLEIDYIPGISEDFAAYVRDIPLDYCLGSVHLVREGPQGPFWFIDGPEKGFFEGVSECFGGDAQRAVTAYYRQSTDMVKSQRPDIIGHMDKVKMHNKGRLFSEEDAWYRALVDELLQAIRDAGVIVELNTRGVYSGRVSTYFPSPWILDRCLHMGIPVMVNADAHKPGEVDAHFAQGVGLLKEIGFKEMHTPDGVVRVE